MWNCILVSLQKLMKSNFTEFLFSSTLVDKARYLHTHLFFQETSSVLIKLLKNFFVCITVILKLPKITDFVNKEIFKFEEKLCSNISTNNDIKILEFILITSYSSFFSNLMIWNSIFDWFISLANQLFYKMYDAHYQGI